MTERLKNISCKVGDELPAREFSCDIIQSFLYNAALWNAHRIHFDYPYATGVEGYPGLVVPGPLMGDWLTQCVLDWLDGKGVLASFEYSNRRAAYTGDALHFSGRVTALDASANTATLELLISNDDGEVVTPGEATVRFADG